VVPRLTPAISLCHPLKSDAGPGLPVYPSVMISQERPVCPLDLKRQRRFIDRRKHQGLSPLSWIYTVFSHSIMSSIPASAIALFAIFLYNCVNAIFGYLTNVVEISLLQLLAFQTVRPSYYSGCRSADDQVPNLLGRGIYVLVTKPPHGLLCPSGTRMSIWAIAVLAIFGSLLVLSTLHQLTLSEHETVMCILPFFTAFVAKLWLGEIFNKIQAMCCCTLSRPRFAFTNIQWYV
jgi:hypothetical protein